MFKLLKYLLFNKYQPISIINKFSIGDICIWPGNIDGCDDAVVEITNWFRDYDKDTQKESVFYEFRDIYKHINYSGVEEKYLNLLATNDELMENVSPYELEMSYHNVA